MTPKSLPNGVRRLLHGHCKAEDSEDAGGKADDSEDAGGALAESAAASCAALIPYDVLANVQVPTRECLNLPAFTPAAIRGHLGQSCIIPFHEYWPGAADTCGA